MRTLLYSIVFLFSCSQLQAQQSFETAGAYMDFINNQYMEIMKDYWSYTSAVGHGKGARKVDGKRKELLTTVTNVTRKVSAMPPFKGDKSMRDSVVAFLKLSYHVLNNDYDKILNMEDVAEQSYDAMEAYLLAQDLANEKINSANDRLNIVQKDFAARNNVQIVESKSPTLKKIELASKVNAYHRIVYLIFFKSFKQEVYMMDALNKKNLSAIEQNRTTLIQFSNEGIAKLDTMKGFNNDKSIVVACKKTLEFYKSECQDKISILTNYYIKEDNFQKIKKAFEAKKESDRTQADVDQFNKGVEELNKAANDFNATNAQLNESRSKNIDSWNKTVQTFLDKHTPTN